MEIKTHFIIVDDDEVNNKICNAVLSKLDKNADISMFTDPLAGFDFIASEFAIPGPHKDGVLLLDISMPKMNGWQFLEAFDKLSDLVKSRVRIFILSSSVDKEDMGRAKQNKYVLHYLIKPLTKETIRLITHSQNKKASV